MNALASVLLILGSQWLRLEYGLTEGSAVLMHTFTGLGFFYFGFSFRGKS